ncbi:hypothetical protein YTPLAS18_38290 [Nitrospira sp.]|nr:hypothetical protein YTPLAS18_38290 [Nitrospira sp.]
MQQDQGETVEWDGNEQGGWAEGSPDLVEELDPECECLGPQHAKYEW